jgi:3-hydroxy-9,10-secoandrosta-1,3,5(10)-triene-9,17-dione monooxygenase
VEYESLTAMARSVKGGAAERAAETERAGRVPAETVEGLKRGGFFRGFQPKRYHGLEAHPADVFGAIIEMASACPSTGWIMGIMGIHQFELARLSAELQEEVLGKDSDTLVSSSYSPQGKVVRASGGFRLTGQWKSSSGVDHAQWVVLGGNVPSPDEGGQPTSRIFYLPITDVVLFDDWDVIGLKGTGSKSVIVDDLFVPEYRSSERGGFTASGSSPSPTGDSPLYRLPQGLMYLLPGAGPAIGAAKGAYEEYIRQSQTAGHGSTANQCWKTPRPEEGGLRQIHH